MSETLARNLIARALHCTRAAAQLRLDELGADKAAVVDAIKSIGDSQQDAASQDAEILAWLKEARAAASASSEPPVDDPPGDGESSDGESDESEDGSAA